MANEFEPSIQKLATYGRALSNIKATLWQVNAAVSSPQERAQVYDADFMLDYMVTTNLQMLVYLSFFQNTNNTLLMKARNKLFESIENIS